MATILIVEDEMKLRDLVRSYLEREQFAVLSAATGAEAVTIAQTSTLDLAIVDLGLPDIDGASVAREIRAIANVPTLILTARSSEADRIAGLELGVDDYVTKPFSPRELVLRVQAILRRTTSQDPTTSQQSFGNGEITFNEARHELFVRGQAVDLTPTEWSLLVALCSNPGRVYSRAELANRARGYEFEGYERTIDAHIKNLRRKIEADPHEPQIVETVIGVGYRLTSTRDSR